MNSIIVYEIGLNETEDVKIIVDMKNSFDDRHGFIWVHLPNGNDAYLKFTQMFNQKPDLVLKMNESTFAALGLK